MDKKPKPVDPSVYQLAKDFVEDALKMRDDLPKDEIIQELAEEIQETIEDNLSSLEEATEEDDKPT